MFQKVGAYVTNASGKVFDVNAEYLFDPKISTYVTVPAGGKLTVIGNSTIKDLYIVASGVLAVKYGKIKYGPTEYSKISDSLYVMTYQLPGNYSMVDLYPSGDVDVDVYFITYNAAILNATVENNRSTSVSRYHPLFEYLSGMNYGIINIIFNINQYVSNSDLGVGSSKIYVQEVLEDVGTKKVLMSVSDSHMYSAASVVKDIIGEKGIFFASDDFAYVLLVGDMWGDGIKRGYLWAPNANTYLVDLYEIDLYGPPYPSSESEILSRIKKIDVDFSEVISSHGLPADTVFTLFSFNIFLPQRPGVVGDIDGDGVDELIVVLMANYQVNGSCYYQEFVGYIDNESERFIFKELLSREPRKCPNPMPSPPVPKSPLICGGVEDAIVYDYDSDGIPEVYALDSNHKYLGVIKKRGGSWVTKKINIPASEQSVVRMALLEGTIYIKTPDYLLVLHPDLTYTKHTLPGVGLREYIMFGRRFLLTAHKIDDTHTKLIFFDPTDLGNILVTDVNIGFEDPHPAFWDNKDNMVIFATYTGTNLSGPGVYMLVPKYQLVTAVEVGDMNLTKVNGATLTPRDWSQDFAKLQNLDVPLSTIGGGSKSVKLFYLGGDATVENLNNAFDGKLNTSAHILIPAGKSALFYLTKPVYPDDIQIALLQNEPYPSLTDIDFVFIYEDGEDKIGSAIDVSDFGYLIIPPIKNKRITGINIINNSSNDWEIYPYEIFIDELTFDVPLSDIADRISGLTVLGYDDVILATDHGGSYTHAEQMFDKNLYTSGSITLPESGEFIVALRYPRKINGIILLWADTGISNITYYIDYDDGTTDTGNVVYVQDVGGYIPTNPHKNMISFALKNETSNTFTTDITEIYVYNSLNVSSDANLTRIGGTQLSPRDWSNDFAKLQNLDIPLSSIDSKITKCDTDNINGIVAKGGNLDSITEIKHSEQFGSAPAASTEYDISLDLTGFESGRVYIIADQQMDVSIQIYSAKAGQWYDVYGMSISSADFKTTDANWIDVDRITQFRVKYVTGSTAPSEVYLILVKKA